jgi:hypothetical protein
VVAEPLDLANMEPTEATMTGDKPNHQQPKTNKRKGKSDISLVLIKRVNLALWLGQGLEWPRLPTGAALDPLHLLE